METRDAIELVATAAFGVEAVVVRELRQLGYAPRITRPGRIEFTGTTADICRANLWLRSADRVLVELARFRAEDFDALFDITRAVPWEEWIPSDAAIPVRGRSRKSQLTSVPACQRTVKKAIVERFASLKKFDLQHAAARSGDPNELPTSFRLGETGPPAAVEVAILDDEATLSLDTTGEGLHKRGYRALAGPAQIRETLAAALVELSFWAPGRPFLDPFCGSGVIAIEAALIGCNIAPGANRNFAAEHWPRIPASAWRAAREEADDLRQRSPTERGGESSAQPLSTERLVATDVDAEALKLARHHAERAGVSDVIHFQLRAFEDTLSRRPYGCLIANPPYGIRLGDDAEIEALYRAMPGVLRRLKTWSHFILTAREDFESLVGQEADRRRKLFNGGLECTYYQFHGPRPASDTAVPSDEASPAQVLECVDSASHAETRMDGPGKIRVQAFGGLRVEASRQADEFANRLRKRARHLRRWPTKRGITCYRIYDRDIPEVPLAIDRYEDALHISEYERPHERTTAEHADWLDLMARTAADVLDVARENVFVKFRERKRGATQYDKVGDARALRIVHEGGLKFQVNLSDFLDTGLFLDHRATRGMVRESAKGARFLNLFAYTGAFTVYAADGGATMTTTVDLSAGYIDWAKENLRLNGFVDSASSSGEAPHQFYRMDVWAYFDQLDKQQQFDLVVIDPPTFSNSKSLETDWDVQRDHGRLLRESFKHVATGGVVFFSTNFRRFKLDEVAIQKYGVSIREISRQTVPEDFRNKRIHRCWKLVKQ